ncbi:hypothetical protein [Streptomyces sp. NPDC051572]|uniref:hypothetical protein n=1 Tax=Streptomyces sp. NPDC051572 TaxID=3155802 RepID=UPI00344F7E98
MRCLILCYSSPWRAISEELTGGLIAAGASHDASEARPRSFYDLICAFDDYESIEAVYERTTDPVTLAVLADELADLLTERGAILRDLETALCP